MTLLYNSFTLGIQSKTSEGISDSVSRYLDKFKWLMDYLNFSDMEGYWLIIGCAVVVVVVSIIYLFINNKAAESAV
jgi:hypothetical protein